MPAAASTSGVRSPSIGTQRPAQHLAPLREAGAHEREQVVGRRHRRPAARRDGRAAPAPSRPSAGARRPSAGPGRPPWPRRSRRPSPRPRRTARRRARRPGAPPPPAAPSPGCARPAAPPRAGASRPARPRCRAGSTRTPTAPPAPRRAGRRGRRGSASPISTRTGRPRRRRRRARRRSTSASRSSSSSATTSCAGVEQRERERAEAGTDLEHRGLRRRARPGATMRRAVLGSARKFWPRLRLGCSPCSSRSAWTVAGVSIAIPVETTGCGSRDFGRSHAPPRPVQHVVRAAPRVPTHLVVDALANDDLLLAGGVARTSARTRRRRTPTRCCT